VCDFELDLFLDLGGHVPMRVASTPEAIIQVLRYSVEQIKRGKVLRLIRIRCSDAESAENYAE
jgi:hypothetical protein